MLIGESGGVPDREIDNVPVMDAQSSAVSCENVVIVCTQLPAAKTTKLRRIASAASMSHDSSVQTNAQRVKKKVGLPKLCERVESLAAITANENWLRLSQPTGPNVAKCFAVN
jgi:hypothetical protein